MENNWRKNETEKNGSACLIVEARVDKDFFEFETQMAISHSST